MRHKKAVVSEKDTTAVFVFITLLRRLNVQHMLYAIFYAPCVSRGFQDSLHKLLCKPDFHAIF